MALSAPALAAALADWDTPSTSAQGLARYEELSEASKIAKAFLYPRDVSVSRSGSKASETPKVTAAFKYVAEEGKAGMLYQDFMELVAARFYLVQRDIRRFMNRLQETSAVSVVPQTNAIMVEMLERLAIWQRAWGVPLRAFNDSKIISNFTSTFHLHLHSSLPPNFPTYLHLFLTASLSNLPASSTTKIPPPSPHLSRLGIFPRYSATLSKVAYEEIERIAREEADKGWDGRRLGKARERVGNGVANWLSGMFDGNEAAQVALKPMYSRFDYYLCKCFFDIRSDELFGIIVDYPDSLAALEDLKECLYKVDQRSVLVDKLKASNVKRLLHPGAETKDVITQYISTIRCLRILDPPGVLLHKVADPIRKHLRDRHDTIRCIVSALVEGEDLQDENEPAGIISQSNDETVENFLDPKWEPEPIDAAPEFRSGKASDIISTLVSIYESREVIMKELQILLATRLLAVKDYDAVKEVRTIELLKLRFGEAALQVCDVMVKDMADSKRINDHVQGDIKSVVHPLVISRLFWPNIQSSRLQLPPKLQSAQQQYEAAFHHFKPDKRLRWLQQIGTANVKLELQDRVVEVEATPVQASIVELFEGEPVWTVKGLAEKLGGVEEGLIKNGLVFWANLGVVKESEGGWLLLEIAEEGGERNAFVEQVQAIENVDENRTEQVRVHWQYIKGVLTNLGAQTLDGIQGYLGYVDDYEQTLEELELFMAAARREGLVDLNREGRWHGIRDDSALAIVAQAAVWRELSSGSRSQWTGRPTVSENRAQHSHPIEYTARRGLDDGDRPECLERPRRGAAIFDGSGGRGQLVLVGRGDRVPLPNRPRRGVHDPLLSAFPAQRPASTDLAPSPAHAADFIRIDPPDHCALVEYRCSAAHARAAGSRHWRNGSVHAVHDHCDPGSESGGIHEGVPAGTGHHAPAAHSFACAPPVPCRYLDLSGPPYLSRRCRRGHLDSHHVLDIGTVVGAVRVVDESEGMLGRRMGSQGAARVVGHPAAGSPRCNHVRLGNVGVRDSRAVGREIGQGSGRGPGGDLDAGPGGLHDVSTFAGEERSEAQTSLRPYAISIAIANRVGNLLGLGVTAIPRAKRTLRAAFILELMVTFTFGALVLIFRHQIALIFTDDRRVAQLAAETAIYLASYQAFDGLQNVGAALLRAFGRQNIGSVIHLVCYYILGLPFGSWLALGRPGMGLKGLWAGQAAALALTSMMELTVAMNVRWEGEVKRVEDRGAESENEEEGEGDV
ncbi:anaphase-promoting complex subunit 2, partial [Tremellales sp. Uapishka_1]